MNPTAAGLFFRPAALALLLASAATLTPPVAEAAGTVDSCDPTALAAALEGGGRVTLGCSGTITFTQTLVITRDTILEAGDQSVVLSGGGSLRLFTVRTNVQFTLDHLTLSEGGQLGTNGLAGAPGTPGSSVEGGAILNEGGSLIARSCTFSHCVVTGGTGGNVENPDPANWLYGGDGGSARGGAIRSLGGRVLLDQCTFTGNFALGGKGGSRVGLGAEGGGVGGEAAGGAVSVQGGQLTVSQTRFLNNNAIGGVEGEGVRSVGVVAVTRGYGNSSGGAVNADDAAVAIEDASFEGNATEGLVARGGAVLASGGSFSAASSRFSFNAASGVTSGGGPGAVYGGALAVRDNRAEINACQFKTNFASAGGGFLQGGFSGGGAVVQESGTLALRDAYFLANSTVGGSPIHKANWNIESGVGRGGGLYIAYGTAAIERTSFVGNLAVGGTTANVFPSFAFPHPAAGQGGAIGNDGELYMTNCTILGNQAVGGEAAYLGGDASGGGLFNGHLATLVNVTFASNHLASGGFPAPPIARDTNYVLGTLSGGSVSSAFAALSVANTIFAAGTAGNLAGELIDLGHNLSSDNTPRFAGSGTSRNNVDPAFGAFEYYGGFSPTLALSANSPAKDAADNALAPATDQRGLFRPRDGTADIGAFEYSTTIDIHGRIRGPFPAGTTVAAGRITSAVDASGAFHLLGLAPELTHVVTPQATNAVFDPVSRAILSFTDVAGLEFVAVPKGTQTWEANPDGTVTFRYGTAPGTRTILESTEDLVHWSPMATNTLADGLLSSRVAVDAGTPTRFYRIREP